MFDRNKSEKEIKKIDKAMEQLDIRIREDAYEIGQLFYDTNKDNEDTDSIYQKWMDSIRQLEAEKKELYKEKLKLQGLMQCEHCNSIITYGSVFCNNCGQKQEAGIALEDKKICPFCGMKNEKDADFCVSCGKRMNESKEGQ